MSNKYLEKPCTRCHKIAVIPPTKADLSRSRILVKCSNCGKCSRYNIVYHVDGSKSYTLSAWGRSAGGRTLKTVKRNLDVRYLGLSSFDINLALDEKYGNTV